MIKIRHDLLPNRMSFSMYWPMRDCPAAGLPKECVESSHQQTEPQERSPQMLLGLFFHDLIKAIGDGVGQYATQGKALEAEFPLAVARFARRYPTIDLEYQPFVEKIYDSLNRHIDVWGENKGDLVFEKEIESKDGLLFGQPDLVELRDQAFHLIDFKLTAAPEKLAKPKNVAQLNYYAYLVAEAYGRFPSRARVVGIQGRELDVPIAEERSEAISTDARKVLDRLRWASAKGVDFEDLAEPSPSSCNLCRMSAACGQSLAKN